MDREAAGGTGHQREEQFFDVLNWPDVIFTSILPLLTWKDLFNLRAASKDYYRLVQAYISEKTKFVLNDNTLRQCKSKDGCPLTSLKAIAQNMGGLTRLEVRLSLTDKQPKQGAGTDNRQEKPTNNNWLKPSDLYTLMEHNPNLETLVLANLNENNVDSKLLINMAKYCKKIKRLEIIGAKGWPDRLTFNDGNWGGRLDETSNWSQFEYFRVEDSSDFSNGTLASLLAMMKNLEEAHFINMIDLNDRVLFTLAGQCSKLRSLVMQDCFKITDVGLQMAYEYLPTLKVLTVTQRPSEAPQPTADEQLGFKPSQTYSFERKTLQVLKAAGEERRLRFTFKCGPSMEEIEPPTLLA